MQEPPLLSLCVPTYNRAPLLRESLTSILSQIGPDEASLLEVLVMDNASSDDTPDVTAGLQKAWPQIDLNYVRNPQNLGPDRNFLKGITLARGRFVYLISDDDILLPGAVAWLLHMIQAHPDFDGFSLNVRAFRHSPDEPGVPRMPLAEDTITYDPNQVLHLTQTSIGFLSIVAFNKSRLAEKLSAGYYESKIDTLFLQSYLYLDVLAGGHGFAASAEPRLAQRLDNSMPLNFFRIFVTEINSLLVYAEQAGYSREVVQQVRSNNLIAMRHHVSRVKLYGVESEMWFSRPEAIRRLFQVYRFRPYLWLVVVPLMFFPAPLRPFVLWLRRALGRPESIW